MAKGNGPAKCQLYMRASDRDRLEKLGRLERRAASDQLTLVIDEACERRGLDPVTLERVDEDDEAIGRAMAMTKVASTPT
jgi:hypothetical protein